MKTRSINEIVHELGIVNSRIHSKKLLLDEFSDDLGLKLSIKSFEGRREDLLRELADAKEESNKEIDNIKNELKKVQDLLLKTRELYELNPENKRFERDINNLERIENLVVQKLEKYYLERNISIFEVRLTGDNIQDSRIPIAQLGEVLKYVQEVTSSISKFRQSKRREFIQPPQLTESVQVSFDGDITGENISDEETEDESQNNSMLSEHLVNTDLYLVATAKGSVRIILSSSQPTFDNSIFNDTFTIFKDMVACGDNKEALKDQISKIGDVSPILGYKNFLKTLYKNNINMEFSGKTDEFTNYEIFELDHNNAKTIFKALNKKDDPITEEIIKIGMLRAVDLESKRFKFHEDGEDEVISGNFKDNLKEELEDKTFNEIYKIKFLSSIPTSKFKKDQGVQYELLEFLD